MKIRALGLRHVKYTSKKTGYPVEGDELHYSFSDSSVSGVAVDKVFLSASRCLPVPPYVPCDGEISFDRFGRPDWLSWTSNN